MNARRMLPGIVVLLAGVAIAADPLPTADEITALAEKKDWPNVLQAVNRVLALKGVAAQPYDRVDLLMKKGEAQLHVNQFVPASQSMAKAAEEKAATPEQADLAMAWSVLFKRTDAKGYKSSAKAGPVKTYDVLDLAQRKEALGALFSNEYAAVDGKITQAKAATEARPLIALAKDVAQLRAIDRVVNKSNEKTDTLDKTLAANFLDQVKKWAKPADKRLDELAKAGDERVERREADRFGGLHITTTRRGNNPQEVGEVKKYMQQAKSFADAYQGIEPALGEAGKAAIKPVADTVEASYDKGKNIVESANRTN